jgi:hypothetical protein
LVDLPEREQGTGTAAASSQPVVRVAHRVVVDSVEHWIRTYLGIERPHNERTVTTATASVPVATDRKTADTAGECNLTLSAADWLSISEQRFATLTAGRIYYDGLDAGRGGGGLLTRLTRSSAGSADAGGSAGGMCAFGAYLPLDVWLYKLAAGWSVVAQEQHLMGRCGVVGDELGGALLAGWMVRALMQLCFLLHRKWAPYQKWYATGTVTVMALHVRRVTIPLD